VSYYRGDYYQGDFFRNVGRAFKKGVRDIGRAAKKIAPIAGIVLPFVGGATLVGRGIAAAQRVKRAGRQARAIRDSFYPQPVTMMAELTAPGSGGTTHRARPKDQRPFAGSEHAIAAADEPRARPSTTTAARRTRQAREGYRRRRAATSSRPRTSTRRRRRRIRRRSS